MPSMDVKNFRTSLFLLLSQKLVIELFMDAKSLKESSFLLVLMMLEITHLVLVDWKKSYSLMEWKKSRMRYSMAVTNWNEY